MPELRHGERRRREVLHAGIAALEGRKAEATALYDEALRAWRAVHGAWDEALSGLDMALLMDPAAPEVAGLVASTRQILGRLRARPFVERLEAAVAGTTVRAAARAVAAGSSAPAPEVVVGRQ